MKKMFVGVFAAGVIFAGSAFAGNIYAAESEDVNQGQNYVDAGENGVCVNAAAE
ncbi:hypothetical protein [Parasporobacterium paucivorans]|uniref:Uncharacterized protein n=1 Tax=Parasporobacterium paucivorans DSM 15970 TaxID=1122934 RepID=A0A1M6JZE4_9FIRM|nr:hypothetical protein [Parasporobacterium paucivorans]SHJ52045.1 hypothetical protein SAMN02745691_02097 [Parasporobacterium paucivorans DSM 15970]